MSNPPDSTNNLPEFTPTTDPYQPPPAEGAITPPIPPTPNPYPGYPSDYQPFAPPQAVTPVPAPPRRGIAGAVGATIVVLVLIAGGGLYALGRNGSGPFAQVTATATVAATATPTAPPTATATPAPPAGFQYFPAADNSYQMLYPVGWIPIQQTANGVSGEIFASGLTTPNVFIAYPSPQKVLASAYPNFLEQVLKSLPTQVAITDVKLNSTTTTVTLGKNTWTSDAGTFMYGGSPYSGVVLGTDHGTGTFLAVYAAPTATFATAESQYFTTMATSITFLP